MKLDRRYIVPTRHYTHFSGCVPLLFAAREYHAMIVTASKAYIMAHVRFLNLLVFLEIREYLFWEIVDYVGMYSFERRNEVDESYLETQNTLILCEMGILQP